MATIKLAGPAQGTASSQSCEPAVISVTITRENYQNTTTVLTFPTDPYHILALMSPGEQSLRSSYPAFCTPSTSHFCPS